MGSWVEEYRSRGYVTAIRWGVFIFFTGAFLGLHLLGSIIGLTAGVVHHFDSRKRMARLKAEIAALRAGAGAACASNHPGA